MLSGSFVPAGQAETAPQLSQIRHLLAPLLHGLLLLAALAALHGRQVAGRHDAAFRLAELLQALIGAALLQVAAGSEILLPLAVAEAAHRFGLLTLHRFAARGIGALSVGVAFGQGRTTSLARPQDQQGRRQQG